MTLFRTCQINTVELINKTGQYNTIQNIFYLYMSEKEKNKRIPFALLIGNYNQ